MPYIAFTINTWLLLRISKGKHGSRKQKRRAICVQLTEFVVSIIPFVSYLATFKFANLNYITIILNAAVFSILTQSSIGMPWWHFYKPEELQHVQRSNYEAL